jgi:hypothetical protein
MYSVYCPEKQDKLLLITLRSAYDTQFSVHQNIRYTQCNVGYMSAKYSLSDSDVT